jgi:hypothetical protein
MKPKVEAVYEYQGYILECQQSAEYGMASEFNVLYDDKNNFVGRSIHLYYNSSFKELPHYKALKQFDQELEELLK